jgi:hypothetical protein
MVIEVEDTAFELLFPVWGMLPTCGLLTELPRKQRVHHWVSLGLDWKNKGTEGICEVEVFACMRCGKDRR